MIYIIFISCLQYSHVKIPKIIHVKMLNNEEIVSFPHYLVVNHYNADVGPREASVKDMELRFLQPYFLPLRSW